MAVIGGSKRSAEGVGPIGRRVAASLRQIRDDRRLTTAQLSALLSRLGRPILATGITKTEAGDRRIDVDDLVALAVALDTTPNRLLLPSTADDAESVELTPEVRVSALDAWKWATGEEPLPAGAAPPERQMLVRNDRERYFTRENQPHNLPEPYFRNVGHDLRQHPDVVRMTAAVLMEARKGGMQLGALVRLVEHLDMQRRFGKLDDVLAALTGLGNGHTQPVVAAIVVHRGKVLVGRRTDGEPPWTFIAGEQEPGELPADTIVREVKEETGLDLRPGEVIGERDHPATGRHMIYLAARPVRSASVFVADEAELAEVRWANLAEADELLPDMFGPVRDYLTQTLRG
jgi:8-oxo-dGTP diphosphatase